VRNFLLGVNPSVPIHATEVVDLPRERFSGGAINRLTVCWRKDYHDGAILPFMLGSDSIDASAPHLHGYWRFFFSFYCSSRIDSSANRDTARQLPPLPNGRDRPIFPDRTACKQFRCSSTIILLVALTTIAKGLVIDNCTSTN
jgi:hypothetical protein